MDHLPRSDEQDAEWTLRSRLFILAFGLFVFGFLMVTGRMNWFELRPASSAAAAMAIAADPQGAGREAGA